MTNHPAQPGTPSSPGRPPLPRVLLADRGDALVGPLSAALRARLDVVGQLDAELSGPERLLVAAVTFRPVRRLWAERFFKSHLGFALRSRRARAGVAETDHGAGDPLDTVFQTHALFETDDPRTVMYLDCTHRQSMRHWPDWNPLHGRALDRWLRRERRQYHRAAHLFAFSQETARSLVEEYAVPAHRVSVVGAGVNFDRLPTLGRAPGGPPTVLFVGNDFERKGGRELLAAFALLRQRVPDARLRLVGTPYAVPAQDGVEHLGRVHDRERMSRLYAEADVFCLPGFFDPFPLALLEAMAHGLPAVMTPTCGVPEMVVPDVTALLVDHGPTLVTDLADALERLLDDPAAAARMGLLARRRVEERFLWSHVVDRMVPVLERLAAPRGRPGAAPPRPAPHPAPRLRPTLGDRSRPATTTPGVRP